MLAEREDLCTLLKQRRLEDALGRLEARKGIASIDVRLGRLSDGLERLLGLRRVSGMVMRWKIQGEDGVERVVYM